MPASNEPPKPDHREDYRTYVERCLHEAPHFQAIREAVLCAKAEYFALKTRCGLPARLEPSTVHQEWEIDMQAHLLAMSGRTFEESVLKAILTNLSHDYDDQFDPERCTANRYRFGLHRSNFGQFLDEWDGWGTVVRHILERTAKPSMAIKGLRRTAYGGLLIHATTADRNSLLEEYAELSASDVGPEVRSCIMTQDRNAYSVTVKGVQELFFSTDENSTSDLAEAWSMVYGPPVYCHNYHAERSSGEISRLIPTEKLVAVAECGAKLVKRFEHLPSRRKDQLEAVTLVLRRRMPEALVAACCALSSVLD